MLKNMKIGRRLGISFGVILFLVAVGFVFSLNRIAVLSDVPTLFHDHPFTVSNALRDANINIVRMHRSMKDVALAESPEAIDSVIKTVDEYEKEVLNLLQTAREQFLGDQRQFDELIDEFIAWKPIRDEVISLTTAGEKDKAVAITRGKGALHMSKLSNMRLNLTEFADNKAIEFVNEAKDNSKQAFTWIMVLSITILILTTLIGYFLSHSVTDPLNTAVEVVEQVGMGNLTVDINITSKDEIGQLLTSMQNMVVNLRKQVSTIIEGVNALSSSASEISSSVTQLASSASETAASVGETSATVEEVKQTAEVSNQKAKYVSEISQQTEQISQDGKKATEDTTEGMSNIREQMESIGESVMSLSEQSQDIGEITSTVDDISDQVNLLSVNAAIEAAKAGEYGKGFAVVAQEIKSLAEQSKQATTRVRSILNAIQKATGGAVMAIEKGTKIVESGVKQAAQAGESIIALSNSIAEAAQAATQVAASSQQQLVGVDQVATAMDSIKEASSQNSASVKQLETTAQNLYELGQKLKETAERYKV